MSVLAEIVEKPEEIDVERAKRKQEEAERLLHSKSPDVNYEEAMLSLEKATTRLQLCRPK